MSTPYNPDWDNEPTNHYLVTVTVTYRVDDVRSHNEAMSVVKYQLLPSPEIDGLILENMKDGFWSCLREDDNGISLIEAGEME